MTDLFASAGHYAPTAINDAAQYGSATFPPPRDFQRTAHDALREGARAGHKNQMVMAPTGAGKLYLGLRICHEALQRGRRALFICDRTTLIGQTSAKADEYGLAAHGIVQAQNWRTNLAYPFQIASIQTLASRGWPDADVIVIDEAHTRHTAWTDRIESHRANVIGLSATPFSKGLGKLFTRLVNATTANELTQAGVLVPMRIMTCTRADMTGAQTKNGEWTDKAAQDRGLEIIGDVVSEWHAHAQNRKTIVFGATVAHCEALCEQFTASGVEAAVFCGRTPENERKALLDEYRKHDSTLRVLISVEALAKGFDVPDVECVVDCRPLRKSLSTAMQMWGRGLRASPQTNKTDCLLLDHTGNVLRFAEDYERIFHEGLDALDAGEQLDKAVRTKADEDKVKACPACGATPFVGHCMACGHEVRKQSLDAPVAGHMVEVVLGKRKAGFSKEQIWQQAVTYARANSGPATQQGRAAHLYRNIVGAWPPSMWKFGDTPNVHLSHEFLNKVRSLNIAFSKMRKAA